VAAAAAWDLDCGGNQQLTTLAGSCGCCTSPAGGTDHNNTSPCDLLKQPSSAAYDDSNLREGQVRDPTINPMVWAEVPPDLISAACQGPVVDVLPSS
jgi:hypothetical protein